MLMAMLLLINIRNKLLVNYDCRVVALRRLTAAELALSDVFASSGNARLQLVVYKQITSDSSRLSSWCYQV